MLDDDPCFQDDDPVGTPDAGKAVRYLDDRDALELLDRAVNLMLEGVVEGGGGLVDEE